MREFIGVISGLGILTNERMLRLQKKFDAALFKREALMFSRLAVYGLDEMLPRLRLLSSEYHDGVAAEIERLMQEGVIFQPKTSPECEQIKTFEFKLMDKIREVLGEECRKAFQNLDAESLVAQVQADPSSYGEAMKVLLTTLPPLMFYSQYEARCTSICLRELEGMDAYPVLTTKLPSLFNLPSLKNEVVKITLNALPIPDDSTPWEQVLEYRSDPDSQSKFLALRHWMSEVSRAELTPAEVEEKLEYLMDQYRRHMKLHRMKTNVGTLETVITAGAEMLGDLISFKWGKAAQALFSLKKREVALLEGELSAPGNEVAYIVKARKTFS